MLCQIARPERERAEAKRVGIAVPLDKARAEKGVEVAEQRRLVLAGDRGQLSKRQTGSSRREGLEDLERSTKGGRAAAGLCCRHVSSPSIHMCGPVTRCETPFHLSTTGASADGRHDAR